MYLSGQNGMRARDGIMLMSGYRGLSGRASSKTRRSMGRYLRGLGALTPDQATEQVFPASQVKTSAGHNQSVRDQILSSAQAGQILNAQGGADYAGGAQCAGASMTKPVIAGTIGGLALKFAPKAFAAGPIVGGIVVAIAGISELFAVIFGHHAAAIKKEQSVLCAAVPAANQSLQLIGQAVSAGQATPADAIAALNNLLTGFGQQVASIRKGVDPMSSGECNAACVEYAKLHAIVISKLSQYQNMQASAAATPLSVATLATSKGIPSWAFYAAGGFLLWKLAS